MCIYNLGCYRTRDAGNGQGFLRVMNRSAGRIIMLSKTCGSSRVGSGGVRNLTGRVGPGRVGSAGFQKSWNGPGHPDPIRPSRSTPSEP